MKKILKPILFVLVALGIILAYIFLMQEKSIYINEQTAIENATLHCEQFHSVPLKEPRNIKAQLLSCSEFERQTGWDHCTRLGHSGDLMLWYVSMEGLWLHWGPPLEDGTVNPLELTTCEMIVDAKTGEYFSKQSK